MVGDVNIFLNDPDNDMTFGEIEIMIAEEAYRRNGLGLEALMIMMGYGKKKSLGHETSWHGNLTHSAPQQPSPSLICKPFMPRYRYRTSRALTCSPESLDIILCRYQKCLRK